LQPKTAPLMLMVPTLVPVSEGPGVAGAEAAPPVLGTGAEGTELPVWASAEITEKTATARKTRRNLLVIGSIELLGTLLFRE
jgi:hypothetical protein